MLSLLWEYIGDRLEDTGSRFAAALAEKIGKLIMGIIFLWLGGIHFLLAVAFLSIAIFFHIAELPWRDAALWVSGGLGIWSLILALVGAAIIKNK